ncbi:hypothetical protein N657DRAFT_648983 [Parathielavia appendiculata]|uniref:Uncharacterized protein n=1 Tax=Parathielavia appendiculata TaxID=2587402 RepID=A0AAN6Z0I3_9PEZI|nr:hypothetical protein N657DRAFT_648983 [Parathielavia appendiculata]
MPDPAGREPTADSRPGPTLRPHPTQHHHHAGPGSFLGGAAAEPPSGTGWPGAATVHEQVAGAASRDPSMSG